MYRHSVFHHLARKGVHLVKRVCDGWGNHPHRILANNSRFLVLLRTRYARGGSSTTAWGATNGPLQMRDDATLTKPRVAVRDS